jgi:hypothetical protein
LAFTPSGKPFDLPVATAGSILFRRQTVKQPSCRSANCDQSLKKKAVMSIITNIGNREKT